MWRKVLFDFVREECSGPNLIRALIAYGVCVSPLIVIGVIVVRMKLIDSNHPVSVVYGREPLFTLLLVMPAVSLALGIVLRFMIYVRSSKRTKPK